MPFVTEEIWSHLRSLRPEIGAEHIIVAAWPQDGGRGNDPAVEQISRMAEVVRAVRNARREAGVPAGNWVEVVVRPGDQQVVLVQEAEFVTRLARVKPLRVMADGEAPPEKAISLVAGRMEVFLPLEGMVDLDAERERLEREVAALEGKIEHVQKLLGNKSFVDRAPDAIVQQHRDRQAAAESEMAVLWERLTGL